MTVTIRYVKCYLIIEEAGEMAWALSALATLPEDLGSIPNTYMAAHSYF